jgi:hypothetical protein
MCLIYSLNVLDVATLGKFEVVGGADIQGDGNNVRGIDHLGPVVGTGDFDLDDLVTGVGKVKIHGHRHCCE